jgi:protein-L-isoaspartate(D-aspartate) O-methyltransferase
MDEAQLQAAKQEMLRCHLRLRGIRNPHVLAAMLKVPRERFVLVEDYCHAYDDRALPIDCGQTISQPYIVGLMTESLALSGSERVMEIGTGSGYQTAILAELAAEVISIERHAALTQQAQATLSALGYTNITLLTSDGSLGWPNRAPYDRIIVTAASIACPPSLFAQLVEGGTLVIPLGDRDMQWLQTIRKENGKPHTTGLTGCRFVPLIGKEGWPE